MALLSEGPTAIPFSNICRNMSMETSSPIAHLNSSKSIGFICTRSSSLGIVMLSVFFLMLMSEPVSI